MKNKIWLIALFGCIWITSCKSKNNPDNVDTTTSVDTTENGRHPGGTGGTEVEADSSREMRDSTNSDIPKPDVSDTSKK